MVAKTTVVLYSSLSFTAALVLQFFQSKAQFFYIVELKMDPSVYALAIGIWALYNSFNDPAFGWLMDRKPTRWGRRVPWMVMFSPILILSFIMIWAVPTTLLTNEGLLFVWLLIALLAFDTGYTVIILAWAALFPEMFHKLEDRSLVSAIRQVFSIIALVVALVIPPLFIEDGNIPSYGRFGLLLGILALVNIVASLTSCKETHFISDQQFDSQYTLKEAFNVLFTNRNYQAFLFLNMATFFAYGQLLSMFPFFRKFNLKVQDEFETIAYGLTLGVTVIVLFFWVFHSNRLSPKLTFIRAAALFSLGLIPIWFLEMNQALVLVFMAFLGVGISGLLMVVDLLISEIVDKDFDETGKRREGIFFGFNGFFIRLAILLQAVSLSVVSELTGFDQYKENQTSLGQLGIKIQMIFLPFVMMVLAMLVATKFYQLPEN